MDSPDKIAQQAEIGYCLDAAQEYLAMAEQADRDGDWERWTRYMRRASEHVREAFQRLVSA